LALPCIPLLSQVISLRTHVVDYRLEIADPLFKQGSACVCLHESRVTPGCGSFLRTVCRIIVVVCEGRVNPVQLARLDGPLAELIPPRADPTRLDAAQDGSF
jgi:hypothetical protein